MGFLLSGSAHEGQQQGNGDHGRDQKYVAAENQQAAQGGGHTDEGGAMVFGAEPLFHENGDEQGGQSKIDAFKIDGQYASGQTSQHSTGNPVKVVERGYQQTVTQIRLLLPGYQGIGLVGKSKDQIRLFLSGTLVGIDHGNAVKQMPGIDHKGSQGCCQQTCSGGQQGNGHILHGAGVNKQTHGPGPKPAEAAALHEDTESEAQKHITGHDRQGIQKRPAEMFFHE